MAREFGCSACRQRKIKCDRKQPRCGFCQGINTNCSYAQAQKKRGLRAGYVSTLENRLDKLEQEVVGLKLQNQQPKLEHVATSPSELLTPPGHHHDSFYTSSPRSQSDRTAAPELDFNLLPAATLHELCNAWFERYHPWFPVLHKLSILGTLQDETSLSQSPLFIVIKSIVAVTLPHWCSSNPPSQDDRKKLSEQLREQIILQAISNLSLQSLQAVLIVTNLDYGAGKLSEFWNLVALCKRMGVQLGLRDLVANKGNNFNNISTIPPRMLDQPTSLIQLEEKIRAYWVTEVLDSMSSLGVGWNLSLSRAENEAWFPCDETVWAFPENATAFSSFGDSEVSSAFTTYLNLVTHQLYQVHVFLQQSYDATSAVDRARWQAQCMVVDETLNKWRESEINARSPSQSGFKSDSTEVLTAATFDTTIIALYQRLVLPPKGLGEVHGPWYYAIQRCLSACDSISTVIRAVDDADLENIVRV